MKYLVYLILVFLTSCSLDKSNISYSYPESREYAYKTRLNKKLIKEDGIVIDLKKDDTTAVKTDNKNTSLWDKTLIEVSKLLPIEKIDRTNKMVATEWGSIDNNLNELYKITIFVKEKDLSVTIFKKIKINNNWVIKGNDLKKSNDLKNKILGEK